LPPDQDKKDLNPVTSYRVGVDIGGTFTDIVLLGDDGSAITRKVSSTTDNYARAITEGLIDLFAEVGISGGALTEVLHGTTVASNAILEHKGARTGLITTRGFRDVLEIRTLRMPRLYDLRWEKPVPLVERYMRLEVDERINAAGEVERPLDPADAERAVDRLVAAGAEAIAVCLLHSYTNDMHEQIVKQAIERRAPGMPCSISSEVLPEIKEYERSSTTVINAYVRPVVERYLKTLIADLRRIEVKAPLLLMQSNGGLTTAESAARLPMNIVESGPAAGVVGAQHLARRIGLDRIISFDMGGTTAKASLCENGEVTRTDEYSVGGGIMIGSRLMSGSCYVLKVPAIDLAEVGAGGGSIVWIDAGGVPQIGPESAGAYPGPACYGLGGARPTVTDANVVLGYLNPEHLAGGAVRLDAKLSAAAIGEQVATPLGIPLERAAYGAHLIAASNMIRAIKAVSSERGRDPRKYALVAFGGNGPIFAARMAQRLQIRTVIIPPSAGVFSSFGLLYTDVEYHLSRTYRARLRAVRPEALQKLWVSMADEAAQRLRNDGFPAGVTTFRRHGKLRYQGQSFELAVNLADGPITAASLGELEQAFAAEHERTYGHRAGEDEPVEIVSLNLVAITPSGSSAAPLRAPPSGPAGQRSRQAYFGEHGWLTTPVLARGDLAQPRRGPCIVEEYDTTCVIPPGASARLDEFGNIVISIESTSAPAVPETSDKVAALATAR
jgi:N-methylhydantoinase A